MILNPNDLIGLINRNKSGDRIKVPVLDLPSDVECVACFCDQMSQGIVFLLYHPSWPEISLNTVPESINLTMLWKIPLPQDSDNPITLHSSEIGQITMEPINYE